MINNIFVINLKKDIQRLQKYLYFIKKNTQNINLYRFNAIDGSNINNIKKSIELFDKEKQKKVLENWKKKPGTTACFLSHIRLWNIILNNDKSSKYTLIMEDDSHIIPNGLKIVNTIIKKYSNFDILYVGHGNLKSKPINPYLEKPLIGKYPGYNTGLYGYVIKKSSIQKLLNLLPFNNPCLDYQLKSIFDKGYNAVFIKKSLIFHHKGYSTRKNIDNLIKN